MIYTYLPEKEMPHILYISRELLSCDVSQWMRKNIGVEGSDWELHNKFHNCSYFGSAANQPWAYAFKDKESATKFKVVWG